MVQYISTIRQSTWNMARTEYYIFLKVFEKFNRNKTSLYSVSLYVQNKGEKALPCNWCICLQEPIIENENLTSERDLSG